MQRAALAFTLMLVTALAPVHAAGDCDSTGAPQAPGGRAVNGSISTEPAASAHQPGVPPGTLAHDAFDEPLSADDVLARISGEDCTDMATALSASTPRARPTSAPGASGAGPAAMAASTDAAAYKPRTEFDNKPWRFDMNQNGRNMTADEFTAWMEAKGVRVVNRTPAPAALAAPGPGLPPSVAGDTLAEPVTTEDGGVEH